MSIIDILFTSLLFSCLFGFLFALFREFNSANVFPSMKVFLLASISFLIPIYIFLFIFANSIGIYSGNKKSSGSGYSSTSVDAYENSRR